MTPKAIRRPLRSSGRKGSSHFRSSSLITAAAAFCAACALWPAVTTECAAQLGDSGAPPGFFPREPPSDAQPTEEERCERDASRDLRRAASLCRRASSLGVRLSGPAPAPAKPAWGAARAATGGGEDDGVLFLPLGRPVRRSIRSRTTAESASVFASVSAWGAAVAAASATASGDGERKMRWSKAERIGPCGFGAALACCDLDYGTPSFKSLKLPIPSHRDHHCVPSSRDAVVRVRFSNSRT